MKGHTFAFPPHRPIDIRMVRLVAVRHTEREGRRVTGREGIVSKQVQTVLAQLACQKRPFKPALRTTIYGVLTFYLYSEIIILT